MAPKKEKKEKKEKSRRQLKRKRREKSKKTEQQETAASEAELSEEQFVDEVIEDAAAIESGVSGETGIEGFDEAEALPEELIEQEEPPEEESPEEEPAGEEIEESEKVRKGLGSSRNILLRPFVKAATRKAIDPQFWEEAEDALIASDAGFDCATEIVERSKKRILKEGVKGIEGLKGVFRSEVAEMVNSFGEPPEPPEIKPRVIFMVGVNGVGKTTTAAKIGYLFKEQNKKVLYAAADTFRAAGIEQMELWANRVGFPVVRHKSGGDPAAVVFDAIESATAKGIDIVLVDTAGRLHTKKNLMDELNKMWRVAERQIEAPPESILVIDATTGQNGVAQARLFNEALELGSIALTKMDGSAKGGVVMAIGKELQIPVAFIGVGEGMADLRPFNAEEYAAALF